MAQHLVDLTPEDEARLRQVSETTDRPEALILYEAIMGNLAVPIPVQVILRQQAPDVRDLIERILHVRLACGYDSDRQKLDVLAKAYFFTASNARTEALIEPGGFPAERDRQVAELQKLAELISLATPDLEMERLGHEGDVQGMVRRLQQLLDEQGAADRPED